MSEDQCQSTRHDAHLIRIKERCSDQGTPPESPARRSVATDTDSSVAVSQELKVEVTKENVTRAETVNDTGDEQRVGDMPKPDGCKVAEGHELLPNGIPKIVFDISTAPVCNRSGSTPGFKYTGDRCVTLDLADCHLDLVIDTSNPLQAKCMHEDGFQYMWKGVRATKGAKNKGKFFFEVKLVECPPVVMPDTPSATQNVCRVGVSQPLTSLHLGRFFA